MEVMRIFGAVVAVFMAFEISLAIAGGHEGGAAISGDGSCTYVQENLFAGPFNVCQESVGADSCAELGKTDNNADAVHADSACTTDGLVGTCDLGDSKLHYYSGDARELEIGCGFQDGDWVTAE